MTNWVGNTMIRDIKENLLLRCVHNGKMISHMEVLWQSCSSEVKELRVSSRNIYTHMLMRYCLGHKHIVLSHNNTISTIKDLVHGLKEIIGLIEMYTLLPALTSFLVALKIWIMSNENTCLGLLFSDLPQTKCNTLT